MIQQPIEPAADQDKNPAPRCLTSAMLLGTARKVQIDHDGKVYTLHLTRQGKLLLTK